jgi:hypothetical protein
MDFKVFIDMRNVMDVNFGDMSFKFHDFNIRECWL